MFGPSRIASEYVSWCVRVDMLAACILVRAQDLDEAGATWRNYFEMVPISLQFRYTRKVSARWRRFRAVFALSLRWYLCMCWIVKFRAPSCAEHVRFSWEHVRLFLHRCTAQCSLLHSTCRSIGSTTSSPVTWRRATWPTTVSTSQDHHSFLVLNPCVVQCIVLRRRKHFSRTFYVVGES